jgi:hypothetical protein
MGLANTIVGGIMNRDATRDATRVQTNANNQAIGEQQRQFDLAFAEQQRQFDLARTEEQRRYDQARTDQAPWLQAGQSALGRLNDPNAFQASPEYNFLRQEGTRGIEGSAAARGGAFSGNALRALSEFNQGLAGREFGNWWNRNASQAGIGQTTASNLGSLGAQGAANIGSLGQSAAGNIGSWAMNTGNNIGSILQNSGNNRANGILANQANFNQMRQNESQNFWNLAGATNWFTNWGFGGG